MIASDYLTYGGNDYIVVVDRYSNWPQVFQSRNASTGLRSVLREMFATFSVPEEITTDGVPQYVAGETQEFFKTWGVRHRISSVANPHANCRAELGVIQVKRIIVENCTTGGSLDTDRFQQAMSSYQNNVDRFTKMSPAMVVFGRQITELIPVLPGRYSPHQTWKELLDHTNKALAKRHNAGKEQWSEHVRDLPQLKVGNHVYVQNQVGNNPRRWERTGVVVEVRQHDQYSIKMDGSGRATLRNRKFLRKFTPFLQVPVLTYIPVIL